MFFSWSMTVSTIVRLRSSSLPLSSIRGVLHIGFKLGNKLNALWRSWSRSGLERFEDRGQALNEASTAEELGKLRSQMHLHILGVVGLEVSISRLMKMDHNRHTEDNTSFERQPTLSITHANYIWKPMIAIPGGHFVHRQPSSNPHSLNL
jgi:hypothetical protein